MWISCLRCPCHKNCTSINSTAGCWSGCACIASWCCLPSKPLSWRMAWQRYRGSLEVTQLQGGLSPAPWMVIPLCLSTGHVCSGMQSADCALERFSTLSLSFAGGKPAVAEAYSSGRLAGFQVKLWNRGHMHTDYEKWMTATEPYAVCFKKASSHRHCTGGHS